MTWQVSQRAARLLTVLLTFPGVLVLVMFIVSVNGLNLIFGSFNLRRFNMYENS